MSLLYGKSPTWTKINDKVAFTIRIKWLRTTIYICLAGFGAGFPRAVQNHHTEHDENTAQIIVVDTANPNMIGRVREVCHRSLQNWKYQKGSLHRLTLQLNALTFNCGVLETAYV